MSDENEQGKPEESKETAGGKRQRTWEELIDAEPPGGILIGPTSPRHKVARGKSRLPRLDDSSNKIRSLLSLFEVLIGEQNDIIYYSMRVEASDAKIRAVGIMTVLFFPADRLENSKDRRIVVTIGEVRRLGEVSPFFILQITSPGKLDQYMIHRDKQPSLWRRAKKIFQLIDKRAKIL